jgi:hypothetical protein
LSTVPYLKPKRVGIQIPQATPSKLFTCPFLPIICTQLSIFKELFLSFHPICHQARLLGGPVLCVPPIVYYLFAMHLIFILQSSHLDDEDKKNPQPHHMKILNAEQMTNQRLLVKLVILHKKTRTLLIVLYYSIQYLFYASYCIAFEMEEINYLYLYLYLYLYIRKENLGVFSYLSRDTKLSTARLIIVQNRNFSI